MTWLFFLITVLNMAGEPNKEFISHYTKTPIMIDGVINDKEWGNSNVIKLKDKRNRIGNRTDNKMSVYSLWDEDYLYFAFEVKDKNIRSIQTELDHPKLYLDDMVEFLIDTRNKKDSCWGVDDIIYHINLYGQKKDDRGDCNCLTDPSWNGSAKYVITLLGTLNDDSDTDIGYIIELSLSWGELGILPEKGKRIGVNFANGDNGILFDWAGARPLRNPFYFGDLILSD